MLNLIPPVPSSGDMDALIKLAQVLGADTDKKEYLAAVEKAAVDAREARQKAAEDTAAANALRTRIEQEIKTMQAEHEKRMAAAQAEHDARIKARNADLSTRAKQLEDGLKSLAEPDDEQRRRNLQIDRRMENVREALGL
jgi:hypothetical protein